MRRSNWVQQSPDVNVVPDTLIPARLVGDYLRRRLRSEMGGDGLVQRRSIHPGSGSFAHPIRHVAQFDLFGGDSE
jgi:hypothetical protein